MTPRSKRTTFVTRRSRGKMSWARGILFGALLLAACGEPTSVASPPGERAVGPTPVLEPVALDPPSAPGALAPEVHRGADGTVRLTWLERRGDGNGHVLKLSRLIGEGWEPPVEVVSGDDFFANWADRPGLVEAPGGGLFVHRLARLGEGSYAYGIELLGAPDDLPKDQAFATLGWLHEDRTPTEHGFVSYVAAEDGSVRAFWLDGRGLGLSNDDAGGGHGGAHGTMQLRTAVLEADGAVPPASEILDDRVCECCATDAVMTSAGPLVAYRDRSEDEIRDIYTVRATADGWSAPSRVAEDGWRITGCPVNGPAAAAAGEDVVVTWFTGADERPRVRAAFSGDAGTTWGEAFEVDADGALGRLDVVLDADGSALVSLLAQREDGGKGGGEIRLWRVTAGGLVEAAAAPITTSTGRASGVPRLVRLEDDLEDDLGDNYLLVWVETGEPAQLRAVRLVAPTEG